MTCSVSSRTLNLT